MRISEIAEVARRLPSKWKDDWAAGERVHYEYHCTRSHDSGDAELWYRSQQPATVVGISAAGNGATMDDRLDAAEPRVYSVRFDDGFVGDAWEDELLTDSRYYREEFCPPPQTEIDRGRAKRAQKH